MVNLVVRRKKSNSSIFRAMIRCIMQTEFLINTCVTVLISTIDIFVCYAVIEKKYYLFCFPRELSQTSAGNASHGNVDFSPYRNKSLKAGIESCYSPPSYST